MALKNAVYVLPRTDDCLEDFEWIAQEAIAGGGEAHVCEAGFLEAATDAALIERFREQRDSDYAALAETIREESRKARRGSGTDPSEDDLPARLARSRRRFDDIARIDFFRSKGRDELERLLGALERIARSRGEPGVPRRARSPRPSKRAWVTRKGIKVDRIASAWFIRRFVDARARFRFIDPKSEKARSGEIAFDMIGGDFTHEADRCTFETLRRSAGIKDTALGPVAEIVHDIDLKDGKFGRPETRGIEQLVTGIIQGCARDEDRLDRGFALFDDLYESFRRKKPASRREVK